MSRSSKDDDAQMMTAQGDERGSSSYTIVTCRHSDRWQRDVSGVMSRVSVWLFDMPCQAFLIEKHRRQRF